MGFAASPALLLALPICNPRKCPEVPEVMSLLWLNVLRLG